MAGRLGASSATSSARSRAGSQLLSSTASSPPPLRTWTAGAGVTVAALIVVYEVSRNERSLSENSTNAVPTDGWPFSSSVVTRNTESAHAVAQLVDGLAAGGELLELVEQALDLADRFVGLGVDDLFGRIDVVGDRRLDVGHLLAGVVELEPVVGEQRAHRRTPTRST